MHNCQFEDIAIFPLSKLLIRKFYKKNHIGLTLLFTILFTLFIVPDLLFTIIIMFLISIMAFITLIVLAIAAIIASPVIFAFIGINCYHKHYMSELELLEIYASQGNVEKLEETKPLISTV